LGPEGLIALKTAPPPVAAEDAERLALEVYGISARTIALPGERDRNFHLIAADGREYVLKFVDRSADATILDCQTAVLRHLAEQAPAIPVPRIIESHEGQALGYGQVNAVRYALRLVTFLPGVLAASRPAPVSTLDAVGRCLASLDGALAGFFHVALGQRIVWDVRQAIALREFTGYLADEGSRRLARRALDDLAARLSGLKALRAQAIHGDCHPRNLLLDDAGTTCVGILDFGDMIHGPLALEPAVAMAEFLAEGVTGLEPLAAMLAGYVSVQPLAAPEVELLFEMVGARLAATLLIHAWRSRHDADGAQFVEDSVLRTTEALDGLYRLGRAAVSESWHRAAGTSREIRANSPAARGQAAGLDQARPESAATDELLARRRRFMGAHAELSYARPLHLVRGSGVWVYTAGGDRLLDCYNNVPHVGHAHPIVVNAIAAQARRIASNTRYLDANVLEYAERLTATMPDGLDTCLFVNSGSEANDVAWRIARAHTGAAGALVMMNAYHGITEAIAAMSPYLRSSGLPHIEPLAAPPGNVAIAEAGVGALAATAQGEARRAIEALAARGFGVAAFIVDSAFTSNGIYDPPPEWMAPIVAAVRAVGGLVIGDEVQYGLGRSGSHFWGFARRGYIPDLVTLGKPVANGYPLGVVVTRREILEAFQKKTGFFSTFGGNPVAAAAGLAVLDVLESEKLTASALATGDRFRQRLREFAASHRGFGEVRGHGLMLGVDVIDGAGAAAPHRARRIVNGLREQGVLIGSEGPHGSVLKLRPPMCFGPEHVERVLAALEEVTATTVGEV
jgi:4-aminobutyrate aminotransferase-like enzyme/Ser/Thr protein kinase RdoA (MazF antagonist)